MLLNRRLIRSVITTTVGLFLLASAAFAARAIVAHGDSNP